MRFKIIFLAATLASLTLIAASTRVQAQVCPHFNGVVPPSNETRDIRNQQLNYRFKIPVNYRTMALRDNRILIFDPRRFEEAQCLVRNRAGIEFPSSISVVVEPINPGKRSVADILKQRTLANITGTRKIANQTAVTYTTDAMGYGDTNVSFFTSDRKYMITISAPFQAEQNASGERVRGEIFNEAVFNTVLSSFTFARS
ncbi:MAG TPA: hypothetical protein V6C91_02520 [Coleofasciculaceae cyanobacterium]